MTETTAGQAPFDSLKQAVAYAYAVHRGPKMSRQSMSGPTGYRCVLDGVAVFACMTQASIDPWGSDGEALESWARFGGAKPTRTAKNLRTRLVQAGLLSDEMETLLDFEIVEWTDPETGAVTESLGYPQRRRPAKKEEP